LSAAITKIRFPEVTLPVNTPVLLLSLTCVTVFADAPTLSVTPLVVVFVPSVAWTVIVFPLLLVGVPLMTPALERDNPMGREPEVIDHVYAPDPPCAVNV
jgi:hypothetical protein